MKHIFGILAVSTFIVLISSSSWAEEKDDYKKQVSIIVRDAIQTVWSKSCKPDTNVVGNLELIMKKTDRKDPNGKPIYTSRLLMNLKCVFHKK